MNLILLLLGFVLLIKGADLFVGGASSIAKVFNISPIVIGLTIVAMGTSLPEAAVSISSSLAGQNDICIANVVGSNLFNMLVVLGVSSLMANLSISKHIVKNDLVVMVLSSALLLVASVNGTLSIIDGFVLLSVFIYYTFTTIKDAKSVTVKDEDVEVNSQESAVTVETEAVLSKPMWVTILLSIIGIIAVVVGGDFVVNSASSIAKSFGMSSNLIGLTIVAMGTSLPELVTSLVAVKKGETDIAIGNVVGSNIFNILMVLGVSSVISPIKVSDVSFIDTCFMTFVSVLLFVNVRCSLKLTKKSGIIYVISYIGYMIYTICR